MKVGDLVEFNKTGAVALIIETDTDGGYTAMNLHVLGDVLVGTACDDGFTWMSEHMLRRTAEVIN